MTKRQPRTEVVDLQSLLAPHTRRNIKIDTRTLASMQEIFEQSDELQKFMRSALSSLPGSESHRLSLECAGAHLERLGRLCVNVAARIQNNTVVFETAPKE